MKTIRKIQLMGCIASLLGAASLVCDQADVVSSADNNLMAALLLVLGIILMLSFMEGRAERN